MFRSDCMVCLNVGKSLGCLSVRLSVLLRRWAIYFAVRRVVTCSGSQMWCEIAIPVGPMAQSQETGSPRSCESPTIYQAESHFIPCLITSVNHTLLGVELSCHSAKEFLPKIEQCTGVALVCFPRSAQW